ncbi:MAG: MltA domain-containing protein, partial [Thermodesulfobacteriota bacterium]|nr:MltA domain-containing protein [Thermodesulfobacteriota bacterium]
MVRLEPGQWPNLGDDLDPASLKQALDQSRVYLRRLPGTRSFKYGSDTYTASHLLASLDAFEQLYRSLGPGQALNRALAKDFILYKSVGRDGAGDVLCTGYYEPLLSGSLTRSDRFCWPAYQRPPDLIEVALGDFSPDLAGKTIKGRLKGKRLIPYYTRREIDRQNALAGQNLELVWVDDPVALFFLHIQGSGRIRLSDGRVMRVGYAGANGRPYRSLGRRMIELELLSSEDMSMQ